MPRETSEPGGYVLVIGLEAPWEATIGRLGPVVLAPGTWVYVGSALGGMVARARRHLAGPLVRKWHIDWLTSERPATGAVLIPSERRIECQLAAWLARNGWSPGPRGFGASDCRCKTHLLGREGRLDPQQILEDLPSAWRRVGRVLAR